MAIGVGAKLARLLLLTFNLIFWLSGIGLVGTGIWLLVDPSKASMFAVVQAEGTMPMISIAAYVIIGIGCFVLLVGFLGCCGAMHENRCMLVTYFAVLLIILLGELVAGILVVIYKNQLESGLQNNMVKNLRDNYGISDSVTKGFDFIQFSGSCCGVNNSADYNGSIWKTNHPNAQVPNTCCVPSADATWENPRPAELDKCQSVIESDYIATRHLKGCYEQVKERLRSIPGILAGVGVGIGALELLGMVFAICLCRNVDYDI